MSTSSLAHEHFLLSQVYQEIENVHPSLCAKVEISLIQDTAFEAKIEANPDQFCLTITNGLVASVEKLGHILSRELNPPPFSGNTERSIQLILTWLLLHELFHVELSHFSYASYYRIAQRAAGETTTRSLLPPNVHSLAPLCLEMQADHEATDTLLGAYFAEGWHEVREKVLAISGMMVLIELEDAKDSVIAHTHPKAATRIFQLLGHVAEMPLVRAQVEQDASLIPVEDELQAFAHEVTIPCFFDAIQLAQAARATSIADDLGSPENFFKDLEIAKLGDPSRYGELKTHGARQWAELWPANEALKPILGGHFTN